jgi:hypothetical protein
MDTTDNDYTMLTEPHFDQSDTTDILYNTTDVYGNSSVDTSESTVIDNTSESTVYRTSSGTGSSTLNDTSLDDVTMVNSTLDHTLNETLLDDTTVTNSTFDVTLNETTQSEM